MKITITREMTLQAHKLAAEFHALDKTHNNHIFSGTPEQQLQRKYYSYVSELAIKKWFDEEGLSYEEDTVVGRKDKYDFLVNGWNIDVKVTPFSTFKQLGESLLLNKQQADSKTEVDIYLFTMVRGADLVVMGWEVPSEMHLYPVRENLHSPAYSLGAGDLSSPASLIKKIKEQKT